MTAVLAFSAFGSMSTARGATTIGVVAPEPERGPSAVAFAPGLVSPDLVPASGVITSWSFNGGPGGVDSGEPIALKVFRSELSEPEGLIRATVVGTSRPEQTPSGVKTFKTRIPVSAGDSIGIYSSYTSPFYADPGSLACGSDSEGKVGESYTATQNTQCLPQTAVNVAARLEPDTDADGFGDEGQDRCLGLKGKAQGCPGVLSGKVRGGLRFEIRLGYIDDGNTLSSPRAGLVVEHLSYEVEITCHGVTDRFGATVLNRKHSVPVHKDGSFTIHLFGASDSVSTASRTNISGHVKGTKASGRIDAAVHYRYGGRCKMPPRRWSASAR